MNHTAISALITILKEKQFLSELEADILETAKELDTQLFDREKTISRIRENNMKYPQEAIKVSLLPNTTYIPFKDASDDALRSNLLNQLNILCEREIKDNLGKSNLNL